MKKSFLFIWACMAVCIAHAQDITTVERIDFEYDENGVIIEETPYKKDPEDIPGLSRKRYCIEAEGLGSKREILVIKKVQGVDKLVLQTLGIPSDSRASLSVYTVSGIRVYHAEKEISRLTLNLSDLQKGSYIISLDVNEVKEALKYQVR